MIRLNKYFFLFLLVVSILASCKKDDTLPDPEFYVSSELIVEYSREQILADMLSGGLVPEYFSSFIFFGVRVYKIVYNTIDTDDNPVIASGALLVPVSSSRLPMLSFQHGTITKDSDAPSNFLTSGYNTSTYFSATGYILAMPDYLGYGASAAMEHPYEHGRSLATAGRDMLRAVYEFEKRGGGFKNDGKLFLTGYSEGGYATMAMFKLLEEEHAGEFSVTAVSAGAGAYDKLSFGEYVASADEELFYLNSFLWVLDNYNKVYKLNRPYSSFFNEPYASLISSEGVFATINKNPQILFQSSFLEGILDGSDTEFRSALADNNNYDWKPRAPLRLYHGTDDDYVPYFNSQAAYTAMTARGAQVELVTVNGGDHSTTLPDYLFGTFSFFLDFKF